MVDVVALRSEMENLGIPKTVLANKLGVSRQTLDNKFNNPDTITVKEALIMCDALKITDTGQIMDIFFAHDV